MRSVDFANTMHKVADQVAQTSAIPFLQVADATAEDVRAAGMSAVGLREASRLQYRRIMRELADRGAEAILLGCTEVELLVGAEDSPVPVFDTTRIHAKRAVELALQP